MKKKYALIIFVFCFLIYANSLGNSFIWDDQAFVVHNPAIKTLLNFKYFFTDHLTTALGELARDVYRPITTLSYAIDYFVWALNAFGYHLINVIFHSLNGVLVFILLNLIFGNLSIALIGGLIFVSHPVQTEVVSWISGRSSVLFTFFYLSSFIFYIKSRKDQRRKIYLMSLILFALSIFSKEMAITLPAILMLYDLHFAGWNRVKSRTLKYFPYFAIAAFYMCLRILLVKQVGQFVGWGSSYSTFLTMCRVLSDYVIILIWPAKLCAVGYDMPMAKSILEPHVLLSVSAIVFVLAMLPFLFKRLKTLSFSIFFFFITLLPVLNIIPIKALKAERFLYLPSIGFCVLVSFLILRLAKKFDKPRVGSFSIIMLVPIILIMAYGARTIIRNQDWKNEITIGRAAFEAYPACAWSITTLGQNYFERDNYPEAIKYLEKALLYAKDYDLAHHLLGMCYLKTGRYEEAASEFRRVLEINPDSNVTVRNFLGVAYASLGRYDEAVRQFNIVVKMDPAFISAYLNLGRIHETKGRYGEAIKDYLKIILNSSNSYYRAVAYMRLGDVYSAEKKFDRARENYRKAIRELPQELAGLADIINEKLKNLP